MPAEAAIRKSETRRFSDLDDASARSVDTKAPDTYRNTLVLVEVAGKPATVTATLHYNFSTLGRVEARGQRSVRSFSLAANQRLSIGDLALAIIGDERLKYGDLRDMELDVAVTDGEGRVIPVLEGVENRSGDVILRTE